MFGWNNVLRVRTFNAIEFTLDSSESETLKKALLETSDIKGYLVDLSKDTEYKYPNSSNSTH